MRLPTRALLLVLALSMYLGFALNLWTGFGEMICKGFCFFDVCGRLGVPLQLLTILKRQNLINLKYYMIIQVIKMSTTVEIKGELELYLRQLIDAGLYNNVAEAVRDSIRHLMKEYDKKKFP